MYSKSIKLCRCYQPSQRHWKHYLTIYLSSYIVERRNSSHGLTHRKSIPAATLNIVKTASSVCTVPTCSKTVVFIIVTAAFTFTAIKLNVSVPLIGASPSLIKLNVNLPALSFASQRRGSSLDKLDSE